MLSCLHLSPSTLTRVGIISTIRGKGAKALIFRGGPVHDPALMQNSDPARVLSQAGGGYLGAKGTYGCKGTRCAKWMHSLKPLMYIHPLWSC